MGLFRKTVNEAAIAATDTVMTKVSNTVKTNVQPTVDSIKSIIPLAGFFLPLLRKQPTGPAIHIHDCNNCNITIIRKRG